MTIYKQLGQAMIEALLLIIVLASLFIAVIWINKLQDIGLQLNHQSRNLVFKYAYQKTDIADNDYLQKNIWLNRQTESLINNITINNKNNESGAYYLVGKNFGHILPLFDELKLGDSSILKTTVSASIGDLDKPSRISNFDRNKLTISRYTSIMTDVKTIPNDSQIQENLRGSKTIWHSQANKSIALGHELEDKLQGIDQAWGRPLPNWDWLGRWASQLPARHLINGE